MNVAVVDVGSNTIRLLVGARAGRPHRSRSPRGKRVVGLGADVERLGAISAPKLAETVECVAGFVDERARRRRRADRRRRRLAGPAGAELRRSSSTCSRARPELEARVLSREEEARLAFEGALAGVSPERRGRRLRRRRRLCPGRGRDGRARARLAPVDRPRLAPAERAHPAWRSAGQEGAGRALRGGSRGGDRADAAAARRGASPSAGPRGRCASWSARTLGPDELREAFGLLRRTPAAELAARYGIDLWRARALPAGAAIVAALQWLLGVPLEVGRGGLREGVVLELLDRLLPAVQAGGR